MAISLLLMPYSGVAVDNFSSGTTQVYDTYVYEYAVAIATYDFPYHSRYG